MQGAGARFETEGVLWKYTREVLKYRLGPWSLGQWTFRGARLETSFLLLNGHPALPDWSMVGPQVQVLMCPALPVTHKLAALTFRRAFMRYVTRQEERYYVAFIGTFDEYLKHFPKKPRYNLQRSVRKFAELSGGKIAWAEMKSEADMETFHKLAVAISQRSYRRQLHGFYESAGYRRKLIEQAREGLVRGYVLMHRERPVAFARCRIQGEVITYATVAYDRDLRDHSPGTVLLYLILKRLFESKEFRYLDFSPIKYFYKSFFATDHQLCARTLFFRWSPSSLIAVVLHLAVTVLSKMGSSAGRTQRKLRTRPA
jgi:CelD/BcsL family acetyltransferase involved in cellulose biosynthesis